MNIGNFNLGNLKLRDILANPKQRDLLLAVAATCVWLLLILIITLATRGLENKWEFGIFLGRFHILVLHVPIGLLVGALAVEIFKFFPALRPYAKGSLAMLWLALFGGIGATLSGFLLMVGEQTTGKFMTMHLWTGLGVVVFTAIILVMKILEVRPQALLGAMIANLALTSYSSHEGGNMVHGEEYLGRYAPGFLAPLLGYRAKESAGEAAALAFEDRVVYRDILQPVFDVKCVECHTEGKVEGKLRMDCFEELAKGGDIGDEWVAGDAENSELYIRVVLEADDDEYMPPTGKAEPMTPGEIAIMGWWINKGASPTMTIREGQPDEKILGHLKEYFASKGKES